MVAAVTVFGDYSHMRYGNWGSVLPRLKKLEIRSIRLNDPDFSYLKIIYKFQITV